MKQGVQKDCRSRKIDKGGVWGQVAQIDRL